MWNRLSTNASSMGWHATKNVAASCPRRVAKQLNCLNGIIRLVASHTFMLVSQHQTLPVTHFYAHTLTQPSSVHRKARGVRRSFKTYNGFGSSSILRRNNIGPCLSFFQYGPLRISMGFFSMIVQNCTPSICSTFVSPRSIQSSFE